MVGLWNSSILLIEFYWFLADGRERKNRWQKKEIELLVMEYTITLNYKNGASISRAVISIRVQNQHALLIPEATEYCQQKWTQSSVSSSEAPAWTCDIVRRAEVAFSGGFSETVTLHSSLWTGERCEICSLLPAISVFKSEGFIIFRNRWHFHMYGNYM